jgi:ABC-type nitrate/sulfonate/bicarbonate transport system substrate-binding protein
VTLRRFGISVLVLLGSVVSACRQGPPTNEPDSAGATATAPPAALRKSGTIRFSLQGASGPRDVPWQMAMDSLREQGYTVETVNFARSDLIPEALLRRDLDVGSVNPNVLWVAVAKGADLRTIAAKTSMTYRVVARREIGTCRDLHGRSMAINSTRAMSKAMFDAYVSRHCPETTPTTVIISETASSLAALHAGEIDSAILDFDDWLHLEDQAPGRFHILVDVADAFPEIQLSSFTVRTEWAKQEPELVKDFLRALLAANRRAIEDPRLLQDETAKRMSLSADRAKRLADAFVAESVWDVNGGLTEQNVQATLDFLVRQGSVPAGLKADDVADLSYLNAVLDEMGRK